VSAADTLVLVGVLERTGANRHVIVTSVMLLSKGTLTDESLCRLVDQDRRDSPLSRLRIPSLGGCGTVLSKSDGYNMVMEHAFNKGDDVARSSILSTRSTSASGQNATAADGVRCRDNEETPGGPSLIGTLSDQLIASNASDAIMSTLSG